MPTEYTFGEMMLQGVRTGLEAKRAAEQMALAQRAQEETERANASSDRFRRDDLTFRRDVAEEAAEDRDLDRQHTKEVFQYGRMRDKLADAYRDKKYRLPGADPDGPDPDGNYERSDLARYVDADEATAEEIRLYSSMYDNKEGRGIQRRGLDIQQETARAQNALGWAGLRFNQERWVTERRGIEAQIASAATQQQAADLQRQLTILQGVESGYFKPDADGMVHGLNVAHLFEHDDKFDIQSWMGEAPEREGWFARRATAFANAFPTLTDRDSPRMGRLERALAEARRSGDGRAVARVEGQIMDEQARIAEREGGLDSADFRNRTWSSDFYEHVNRAHSNIYRQFTDLTGTRGVARTRATQDAIADARQYYRVLQDNNGITNALSLDEQLGGLKEFIQRQYLANPEEGAMYQAAFPDFFPKPE